MEYLDLLLAFLAGGLTSGTLIRRLWPRIVTQIVREKEIVTHTIAVPEVQEEQEVLDPTPSGSISPPRCKVVFRFEDGTKDMKTLFQHSIAPVIVWRGSNFEYVNTKHGILIYSEVNRGR